MIDIKLKNMKHLFAFFFLAILISGQSQNQGQYAIANTIHLPGDGSWDYLSLDSKGRLYVSHGSIVQIVDSKNGKLLGTIENLDGAHGIALAESLNKGFISSGKDASVTIFDLNTFAIIGKVKVPGENPDSILFDPFSNNIFTFNGGSADATVIDAVTHQVIGTIPLQGKPEFSVTDKNGKIYVNIEDVSMLTCINTKDLKVEKSWSIHPGEEPSGLAADFSKGKLFIVCSNKKMIVFDLATEKIEASLEIGDHTDGVAFDEGLNRIYSSNGDGTLTVVRYNNNRYEVLESFPTKIGARTICLDKKTHHIFLPTADFEPLVKGERWPKRKPGTFVVLDVAPN